VEVDRQAWPISHTGVTTAQKEKKKKKKKGRLNALHSKWLCGLYAPPRRCQANRGLVHPILRCACGVCACVRAEGDSLWFAVVNVQCCELNLTERSHVAMQAHASTWPVRAMRLIA
jgi:hypothetical protein